MAVFESLKEAKLESFLGEESDRSERQMLRDLIKVILIYSSCFSSKNNLNFDLPSKTARLMQISLLELKGGN